MENVLNEYESKDLIYRTLFSKLTFLFSIWNCVLFSYAIFSVPTSINTRNGAPAVSKLLICVIIVSVVAGVVLGVIGVRRREKMKFWGLTGLLLNVCMLLLLLCSIGFVFYLNAMR